MEIAPDLNYLELIKTSSEILIGITAVFSLWVSMRALRKSDWNSAMNTSPSIILRPKDIWVGTRKQGYAGYGVVREGGIIKRESHSLEIVFTIEFECFNAGRGVAFNISQPKVRGLIASEFNRIPLYQTVDDNPFEISLSIAKSYDEWVSSARREIVSELGLTYTNDQSNIYCKSSWKAKIKPFDLENKELKVREIRLLNRSGKIEYSATPFEL